jgi:hypothetical protein
LFKLRTTITPSGQVLGTTEDLAHDLKIFHELLPVLLDMIQALDVGQAMATDSIAKSDCLSALHRYVALEKQHPESITVHIFGVPDWPVDSREATIPQVASLPGRDRSVDMGGS